jgi:hypothetical protein
MLLGFAKVEAAAVGSFRHALLYVVWVITNEIKQGASK